MIQIRKEILLCVLTCKIACIFGEKVWLSTASSGRKKRDSLLCNDSTIGIYFFIFYTAFNRKRKTVIQDNLSRIILDSVQYELCIPIFLGLSVNPFFFYL